MSVLASKRTMSELEYHKHFVTLYSMSAAYTAKVPIRKQVYLSAPIESILNEIYLVIGQLADERFKYMYKAEPTSMVAEMLIQKLHSLQPFLLALWNIERYETRKMARWANSINREMRLFADMGEIQLYDGDKIIILDWNAVHNAEFVETMCKLQREIYSHIISSPRSFRNNNGNLLVTLSNQALACIADANRKIPETKDEYLHRKECISIAIDCLKQMNTPLLDYYTFNRCTDRVQTEMSALLAKEIKLLQNLLRSDAKRFSELIN